MSTTALTGAAPQAAAAGAAPPSISDLAHALIAAHTSGGHTDVQALATAVAQTSTQLGGHDPQALADAVGDQLRGASQSDASAFARAAGAGGAANTAPAALGPLTAHQLRTIMPGSGDNADAYVGVLNTAMAAHGIVTREQRAAFLGQVAAETGNLHTLVENDNYTAQRAHTTWRNHFPTVASAAPYAHHAERLTNHVYAGANGNGDEASGDGYRFRGRGFIQVTGRANYAAVGHEADPERLTEPAIAADSAASHWQAQGLNERTTTELNRSGYDHITRTINAGGLQAAERWSAYQRALDVR